jgi:hypothetical protein
MRASRFVIALVVCAGVLAPRDLRAQAWPAPAGAGAVTLSTQVIDNTGHRLSDGFLLQDGKSRGASAGLDVDFAFTDRLAVSLGLPYVAAKFVGPGPPPLVFRPVDRCHCWNSAWQNVSAAVRYNVINGVVALTPSLTVVVPSHEYEWLGEAVVGSGLRELRLAVDAGVRLERVSPRLAVSTRYQYAVVEDVLDVPNNRSNASLTVSYLLSERLSVRGGASVQRTHGGLRFGSLPGAALVVPGEANTAERFFQHDRLLRDNHWHVGGGVTYSLPRVDVFASYLQFVAGTDTHAGKALTLGVSVPFQR